MSLFLHNYLAEDRCNVFYMLQHAQGARDTSTLTSVIFFSSDHAGATVAAVHAW